MRFLQFSSSTIGLREIEAGQFAGLFAHLQVERSRLAVMLL